jgi:hypothetical protein
MQRRSKTKLRKPAGAPFEKQYSVDSIIEALGNKALKINALKKAVMDATGMSRATFFRLRDEAAKAKLIAYDGQTDTWEQRGKP